MYAIRSYYDLGRTRVPNCRKDQRPMSQDSPGDFLNGVEIAAEIALAERLAAAARDVVRNNFV